MVEGLSSLPPLHPSPPPYDSMEELTVEEPQRKRRCAAKAFFILPYNELAIAQGPKIHQRKNFKSWEWFNKKKTQIACKFGEIIKKL